MKSTVGRVPKASRHARCAASSRRALSASSGPCSSLDLSPSARAIPPSCSFPASLAIPILRTPGHVSASSASVRPWGGVWVSALRSSRCRGAIATLAPSSYYFNGFGLATETIVSSSLWRKRRQRLHICTGDVRQPPRLYVLPRRGRGSVRADGLGRARRRRVGDGGGHGQNQLRQPQALQGNDIGRPLFGADGRMVGFCANGILQHQGGAQG